MPAVAPVPFAPFWGHTDDAAPLAGGALYAFAAGTDTPFATYRDPQGLTLNPHPVVLDDAGYAHVYLTAGVAYKLRLVDALGVQQWEIDQVTGTGAGGGSAAAGLGWGKNTVVVRPSAGSAQAVSAVFPAGVLAIGMTVWVSEALGTSQGLSQVGLGTADLPDAWGVLATLSAETTSTAGQFYAYSGAPQPHSGMVTLTAYGGLFDGAGAVYLTGHWTTLTPGQAVGYRYAPGVSTSGDPVPPQPPASETVAGIVELASSAETLAGTDDLRAVTPLKLAARLPAGAALSVARYSAAGTPVEATPGMVTTSDGRLGVGGTPASADLLRLTTASSATPNATLYRATSDSGAMALSLRKSRGTEAAPALVAASDQLGSVNWQARTRDSGDTADSDVSLVVLRGYVESVDAQGRASGQLRLFTSSAAGTATEKLRVTTAGWVGILTPTPTAPLDITGDTLRLRTARTPASATAAGNPGDLCWDANFLYCCVATNSWKRVALSAW